MPRIHYLIAGIVYFCTNINILFATLHESTTQYSHAFPYPPGSAPIPLVTPARTLDLEFYHPHHLDLPPGHYRGQIPTIMEVIPTNPPLPDALPAQDFSKLGWCPWATAVNYLVGIAPIVYMAWPASPAGVQPDSGMGCDTITTMSLNLGREHLLDRTKPRLSTDPCKILHP
ncbi:hypothetical protein DSO57_1036056 [Entomophthora muscae]|uniref:Uncharacterized protein n=1 Tax=Entomophthora muscae TaxID=34485 RepID=A0ACC2TYE5_9FUNG|nr:hypothetical protein DSO57_1036056 [Entomophthora muscae]